MPNTSIQIDRNRILSRQASEDARQYVYRVIKYCILEMLLIPGQKLNEADMAQTLNVSRTPVHDTILRLSREHLVDIFPRRGAFVARISRRSIEEAVWTHRQMGVSIIQSIYIRNTPASQLETLYLPLSRIKDYLLHNEPGQAAHLFTEYYYSLYILAGDMDLIWQAVQGIDVDVRRLLFFAASKSPSVVMGFVYELTSLTEALIRRDNDNACQIFSDHMSRMLLLIPLMEKNTPDYFTDGSNKLEAS